MIIIAEKIVSGGDSLAKINGKAVFVPQLLPGEKAEIEIVESHKDYDRGKIIKILEKSPVRREPPCPYYGICGGCNLQIADDEAQKQIRLQILQDCFRRAMRLNEDSPEAEVVYNAKIISGESWGYRNRFQFHSGGLKRRAQESIVALDDCPIAVPEVRELLKGKKLPERYGRLHVFNGNIAEESDFSTHRCVSERDFHRHEENDDIQETSAIICGKTIHFDVRGFFQSNIGTFKKAIEAIKPIVASYTIGVKRSQNRSSADSANCTQHETSTSGAQNLSVANGELLDMYSGVGTFSALLGDLFTKTTLVEHNRKALRFADKNLTGIPHDVFAMTGEKWVHTQAAHKNYDAVIIDPPRSGIEKPVMNWLCGNAASPNSANTSSSASGKTSAHAKQRGNSPNVIFSVSCDPVTHARDAALLTAAGFKIKTLMMLDFYPQTSHIESFAVFESIRS
ncbi:MAG: TRAM domain-containing protein [Treponemataceae bacterium]|nr:TRAM domain-containing protein [Treponemataceae bacterium]